MKVFEVKHSALLRQPEHFISRNELKALIHNVTDNLVHIEAALKKAKVVESRTIPMAQGQKQSRFVAWTFCGNGEREKWRKARWTSEPSRFGGDETASSEPV